MEITFTNEIYWRGETYYSPFPNIMEIKTKQKRYRFGLLGFTKLVSLRRNLVDIIKSYGHVEYKIVGFAFGWVTR